jgi:fucose 4-O-acetylase-like acetyltransferase
MKIVKRLVIPYLLFTTLIWLPKAISHGNDISVMAYITDVGGGYASWFVAALVISKLLLIKFKSISSKFNVTIILCIISFICGLLLTKYCKFKFPWYANYGMISMLYIALGMFCRKYDLIDNKHIDNVSIVVLILLYLILTLSSYTYCHYLYIYTISFENFSFIRLSLYILVSIFGIALIIAVCKRLPNNLILLRNIGRDSLIYYFLNGAIITTLTTIFDRYVSTNIIVAILIFGLTTGMIYILSPIINRYIPWSIGIKR